MAELHRQKPRGDYLWCLHCERAYKYGEFREDRLEVPVDMSLINTKTEIFQMCPYPECDGDTVLDGWDWEDVRKDHPSYPKIPEIGKVYPLYE